MHRNADAPADAGSGRRATRSGPSGASGGEYPPIESYGLLGNMETCALVDAAGSIDWYPVPHLESPSVFAAVLDADRGGRFRVGPADPVAVEQEYLARTNVLQTTFEVADGVVELTDFMPPRAIDADVPTEGLYRKVECTDGTAAVEVSFAPRPNYGLASPSVTRQDGRVAIDGGGQRLVLASEPSLAVDADRGRATGTVTLSAGEVAWFALTHGGASPPQPAACERALEQTVAYWREWAHDHDDAVDCAFDGPWHDDVVRSGLVLKLLTHADTGAIAAAPTTSLPEEVGGVRNWDYRFNWPRDAAFTVQALAHLGHLEEAGDYFQWFLALCEEPPTEIRPLYGLHGETDIDERELDHLHGYRGSRPVRVGNAAVDQRQIDVYGELVLAVAAAVHHGWELDADYWPGFHALVDHVTEVWDEPDSGIWEVRSEPQHFVHSKAMCWTALDRGIALAEANDLAAPVDRWRRVRERIRSAIEERGFDEDRNTFTRSYGSDALDATALLLPVIGFLPFDDERIRGTIAAVRRELETEDGLVKRYDGEDGLPGDEGAFTLCSFWLVDVLALSGEVDAARERFQALLDHASPLGLLPEEFDLAEDGRVHRGNFPQAFSHVGLVNSALYLGRMTEPETAGPTPLGMWLGEGPAIPD